MAKKTSRKRPAPGLAEIGKKLDILIERQRGIKKEEEKLEGLEKKELEKESELQREEETEVSELEKLQKLEQEVKKQVVIHPLKRITAKDVAKGSVGALFGAVAHYTFIYGLEVAKNITFTRAIILFILSFTIGGIFLYATGFRKIKDPKVMAFLPVRLLVLYLTAVAMSLLVLWFFEPGFTTSFEDAFRSTSTVTLIAVIGACTADLIGRD